MTVIYSTWLKSMWCMEPACTGHESLPLNIQELVSQFLNYWELEISFIRSAYTEIGKCHNRGFSFSFLRESVYQYTTDSI